MRENDMPHFFRPTLEQVQLLCVTPRTLAIAERWVLGCESCSPEDAELPFDYVIDSVLRSDPSTTDYIFGQPAHCLKCRAPLFEKTLVEWDRGEE